jgi:CHAT domain-containing protein
MRKDISLIVILVLTLTLIPTTLKAQNTSDEQAVKAVVEKLFGALNRVDIDVAMACWSDKSIERDSFKRWAQNSFAGYTDERFSNFTFIRWKADADQISVDIGIDVKWRPKNGGGAQQDQMIWEVRFVNENGNWKWSAIKYVLFDLAEKLRSTRTPEERMRLLQKERDILSVGILHILENQADQYAGKRNFEEAIRLNGIGLEIADMLKDKYESAVLHNQRGHMLSDTHALDEALKAFESALKLAEELDDKKQQLEALSNGGRVYIDKNKYPEAIAKFEKAVALSESFGIREGLASTLGSIGVAYSRMERHKEALAQYDRSLRVARETNDRETEVQMLANQARVINVIVAERLRSAKTPEERMSLLQKDSDILTVGVLLQLSYQANQFSKNMNFEEAIKINGIALEAAGVLKNAHESAALYDQRGRLLSATNADEDALKALETALALYQKANDRGEEIDERSDIADIYRKLGAYPKALEQLNVALEAARGLKDRMREADVLGGIGFVYFSWSKYAEALENLQAALKINQGSNVEWLRAKLLNYIGVVYRYTSEYDQALEAFRESQKIADNIHDIQQMALAQGNAGIVYLEKGRYLDAIASLEKALDWEERGEIIEDRALFLSNIAMAYGRLGRFKESLEQFERSLSIARLTRDRKTEGHVLVNQAWAYTMDDQQQKAVESLEKWLQIPKAAENKEVRALALFTFALTFIAKDEASPELEKVVASLDAVAKEINNSAINAQAFVARVILHGLRNEWEKVVPLAETMLKTSPTIEVECIAYFYLGLAYGHQKEWKRASNCYRNAIDRVEKVRTGARDPMLQAYLFSRRRSPYFELAKSLLELGADINEVLKISEQAKSRSLTDLLEGSKIRSSKLLSDSDSQEKQELKSKIATIRAQLEKIQSTGNSTQIDTLKQELNDVQRRYEIIDHKVYDANPESDNKGAKSEPFSLDIVKEKIFNRYPNLCLLSYFVENDEVMLFTITQGKDADAPVKVAHYSLKDKDGDDLTEKVLVERLLKFRLRLGDKTGVYEPDANTLYNLLIRPAEAEISGKSHLIIIPDQSLSTLPFQTLIDGEGKHLINQYSISYAPSITALIKMMNLADVRKNLYLTIPPLFALGRGVFPDQAKYRARRLPWAEAQATSIAELFGARPFIGDNATRSAAIAEMGKARYIHLATHGEVNESAPMYSAILLGKSLNDDGMLYAADLMNLDLHAELVTLSACNTALGRQVNGEGIVGLTWALFVAGAPSSVVTQWSVNDDSMNKLMLEFYTQLRNSESQGTHISKAEALRRAQMSLMKDIKYQHPYYWAPTVLVGDWR